MYCPFCKAEYRNDIARCSDCSLPLVGAIPNDDSDPNFMVLLWNGESLPFLETVCAELDKATIPVGTPRVEVLLRDRADRYHLKHVKTFPYVLGVFKQDLQAARKILEAAANDFFPPVTIFPANAYPEPFDESAKLAYRSRTETVLDATVTAFTSSDLGATEFFESSLDGLNVAFRRVCRQDGTFEVRVRPADEPAVSHVRGEIARGTSSQLEALRLEDANLRDDGPQSYFLAWFVPAAYIFVLLAFDVAGPLGGRHAESDLVTLLLLGGSATVIGMFWMVYQALRYEVQPFRYCVAALLPFTFVWYYVERYRVREGQQCLPVTVRARLQRPPSS